MNLPTSSPRLLLIESVTPDRPIRGILYPYLFGLAKEKGLPVEWLRFGVPAAHRFSRGEQGLTLDDSDQNLLLGRIDTLRPTRIAFNLAPTHALHQRIRSASPGLKSALVGTRGMARPDLEEDLELLPGSSEEIHRFLGLPGKPGSTASWVHHVVPDFGFLNANDLARRTEPIPYLILDSSCRYGRGLDGNPEYTDVDLSNCVRARGCTFCDISDEYRTGLEFSEENARIQISALKNTLPAWDQDIRIRLIGDGLLRHASEIAGMISELGAPPATWQFDTRADTLVRDQGFLEQALLRIRETGHRFHVSLLGIENFSRTELRRMNKGLGPEDNLAAIRCLLQLERDHPDSFGSAEGGCSTILFTPWTTLEDVALNLRIVREIRVSHVLGKLLGSRLRLIPGTPMAVLARKDGLTIDEYEDPLFDTASLNLYGQEIPWRFQDSRVHPLCQLLVRLKVPRELTRSDPLAAELSRIGQAEEKEGFDALDIAISLLEEMEEVCPPGTQRDRVPSASELLERWRKRRSCACTNPVAPGIPEETTGRELTPWAMSRPEWWDLHIRLLCALVRLGVKPVAKLEGVPKDQIGEFTRRYAMPHLLVGRTHQYSGDFRTLYFGGDPDRVQRLAHLTRLESIGTPASDAESPSPTREIGELLGYPACCVEAFKSGKPKDVRRHVALRLEGGESIPPEQNPWPFGAISPVPCRLGCEGWIEGNRRILEVVESEFSPEESRRFARSRSHPWLLLLDHDSPVELVPRGPITAHFEFSMPWGEEHPLSCVGVQDANEIVIEPERIFLLHGGRRVADLSMRAFVWSHERIFQSRLWKSIFEIQELVRIPESRPPVPVADKLARFLGDVLQRSDRTEHGLGGYRVYEIKPVPEDSVHLTLESATDRFVIVLRPGKNTERAFLSVGPLALLCPRESPADSAERAHAIHILAEWIAGAIASNRRTPGHP